MTNIEASHRNALLADSQAYDAETREALRAVLKSSKPNRFRLLRVVCDQQHKLLDVYQTRLGPVWVGEDVLFWAGSRSPDPSAKWVSGVHVGRIDSYGKLWLSCHKHMRQGIPIPWLDEQLRKGKKRAVWQENNV